MNRRATGSLVLCLLCVAAPAAAAAADELDQRIGAGQAVASGRAVLSTGHVDVGPRFVGGSWTLMIHDDTAKADGARSVWRHTGQTVLRVGDEARMKAPDDPAYGFLAAAPGSEVFVVPQTQNPDVVWVGWNTQDPEVMETIDRGVTMTLTGVQGPGSLVVYLQSGDFAAPRVLWDSTSRARPVWVDVNTHTHATWVFSEAGVYLARVTVAADLVDGSSVTDSRDLRFAVGTRTSADAAFAATSSVAPGEAAPAARQATPDGGDSDDSGPGGTWVALIAVAAAALAAALAAVLVRGNRAKQRARSAGDAGA
ncbi:choice-of-anchor M domain-containing protein [Conexibacter sp. CPCC 206217]|uniref:choice-of-anchor M domain-containing protein n=1 Tax=Conexibacter sp. CPCC 206217 TaxID=3064574 RepID=UPI00272115C0|nr:choice-of-anchor M domain-containing protein [Conexibacter sp. CPCC 206217]MDO8213121.1 choice-of-anchor M domain-containing protein [Conexibacter sp. CPCC 206217]